MKAPVREVKSTATRWRRLAFGVIFMLGLLAAAAVAGGSVTNPTCGTNGGVVYDGDLGRILATIRHFESRGDYNVRASQGTASGAYQFLDSSWSNYGGYPSAWMAPPEVQDAKAAEWVTIILTNHPNDVSSVPVTWYIGHVPAGDSAEWDTIPYPQFGNVLTPREYQTRWLTYYNDPTSAETPATGGPISPEDSTGPTCVGVVGVGDYRIPDGVVRLVGSSISWGGYENGRIPFEAMRYSPNSNYLHPSASAAWDQLHAAALEAGFNLSGNGYRPRSVRRRDRRHVQPRLGTRDRRDGPRPRQRVPDPRRCIRVRRVPVAHGQRTALRLAQPRLGQARQSRWHRDRRVGRRPVLFPRTVALGMGRVHEPVPPCRVMTEFIVEWDGHRYRIVVDEHELVVTLVDLTVRHRWASSPSKHDSGRAGVFPNYEATAGISDRPGARASLDVGDRCHRGHGWRGRSYDTNHLDVRRVAVVDPVGRSLERAHVDVAAPERAS